MSSESLLKSSRWTPSPARSRRHVMIAVLLTLISLYHLLHSQIACSSILGALRHCSSVSCLSAPGRRPPPDLPQPVINFWHELATEFVLAKPEVEIKMNQPMERWLFDPKNPDHELNLDFLPNLAQNEIHSLTSQHARIVNEIRSRLASHLPYDRGTRGIVMTANQDYLGIAMASILMLRRSGSTLPVQLFLDGSGEPGRARCKAMLSRFAVRCLDIDALLSIHPNSTAAATARAHKAENDFYLNKYQYKVFALLFSSFEQLLYLDADAFPVHNPDRLLAEEPFSSHGLVTWPDFWLPTVSPMYYTITNTVPPDVTEDDRASESGILLYDKSRHAASLLLAAYYNFYGPRRYYVMLSQGAWGQGDKETFLQAARTLRQPAWQVHTHARTLSPTSINYGTGIRQFDPKRDFHAARARARAQAQEQKNTMDDCDTESLAEGERVGDKGLYGGWQEGEDFWEEPSEVSNEDMEFDADEAEEEARRQQVQQVLLQEQQQKKGKKFKGLLGERDKGMLSPPPPLWMFAHLNRVKMDARRMLAPPVDETVVNAAAQGTFVRLWGENGTRLIESAGYDVERSMWDELLKVNCQQTWLLECEIVQLWYDQVFGRGAS